MDRRSAPATRSKHPMRTAGEFFAWLWGPSEASRGRNPQIRPMPRMAPAPGPVPMAAPMSAPVQPVQEIPLRTTVVEQRIEDGRIVLRRTTVEEIEIQPAPHRG